MGREGIGGESSDGAPPFNPSTEEADTGGSRRLRPAWSTG